MAGFEKYGLQNYHVANQPRMGKGLEVFDMIAKGTVVGPYVGEIMEKDHYKSEMVNKQHVYVNALKKGNLIWHINHHFEGANCDYVLERTGTLLKVCVAKSNKQEH